MSQEISSQIQIEVMSDLLNSVCIGSIGYMICNIPDSFNFRSKEIKTQLMSLHCPPSWSHMTRHCPRSKGIQSQLPQWGLKKALRPEEPLSTTQSGYQWVAGRGLYVPSWMCLPKSSPPHCQTGAGDIYYNSVTETLFKLHRLLRAKYSGTHTQFAVVYPQCVVWSMLYSKQQEEERSPAC